MLFQPATSASVQVVRFKRALGACLTFLRPRRRWLATTAIISSAATALLFTASCTSLRVATGQRIRLTETQVYPPLTAGLGQNSVMICPGGYAYMLATLKGPNGETLVTEGEGRGKILWEDLHVTSSVVSYNGSGGLHLPADPRISDGQTPHIIVTVPNHPELRAEFDVPIAYNAGFEANFSGQAGFSGRYGNHGTDGANGRAGSTDPQKPSPGENGTNGTNGTDGENGQPGGDAPAVIVKATLRPGSYPLLQIHVSGGGSERYFMVDPNGGYLTVYADAGLGGAGGRGGRGGTGGVGGAGRPNGRNGTNGANGRDGFAAPAGNGGAITVIYDPAVQPYLSAIRLSSRNGPAPIIQQEPVAPLW